MGTIFRKIKNIKLYVGTHLSEILFRKRKLRQNNRFYDLFMSTSRATCPINHVLVFLSNYIQKVIVACRTWGETFPQAPPSSFFYSQPSPHEILTIIAWAIPWAGLIRSFIIFSVPENTFVFQIFFSEISYLCGERLTVCFFTRKPTIRKKKNQNWVESVYII